MDQAEHFDSTRYQDTASARRHIEAALPVGSSPTAVRALLDEAGATVFEKDPKSKLVSARLVERSTSMVHVVWSFGFYFDDNLKLERFVLSRGLSGP